MLLCSAAAGGQSKEIELGLGLAKMREAGDDPGLAKRQRWLEEKKKKGLSSFGQKVRG